MGGAESSALQPTIYHCPGRLTAPRLAGPRSIGGPVTGLAADPAGRVSA